MTPTMTGIVAAAAVIVAFAAGSMIEIEDGGVTLESPIESEGPLEQVGEAIDDAADN